MSNITIYHNPACGTSRNVLAALREAGLQPQGEFGAHGVDQALQPTEVAIDQLLVAARLAGHGVDAEPLEAGLGQDVAGRGQDGGLSARPVAQSGIGVVAHRPFLARRPRACPHDVTAW